MSKLQTWKCIGVLENFGHFLEIEFEVMDYLFQEYGIRKRNIVIHAMIAAKNLLIVFKDMWKTIIISG